MPRSKDLQIAADRAAIASAAYFTVVRYVGRDPRDPGPILRSKIWDREEHPTLVAARVARDDYGADGYGRRPVIYAVSQDGMTIHVPEDYELELA